MPNTFSRVLFVFVLALTSARRGRCAACGRSLASGDPAYRTRCLRRAGSILWRRLLRRPRLRRPLGDGRAGHAAREPPGTTVRRSAGEAGGRVLRCNCASWSRGSASSSRKSSVKAPGAAGGDGHQGSRAGRSKIKIVHKNKKGGTFQLVKLIPPGQQPGLQQVDDSGELGDLEDQRLRVVIAPGDHTVSVEIEYRGYGHGIFSYLQGRFASTPATRSHCGRQGVVIQDRLEQGTR